MERIVQKTTETESTTSASMVTTSRELKDILSEFSEVFRQEVRAELPPRRAFAFDIRTDISETTP